MHGGNVELLAPRYGFDAAEVLDFSANINPYGPPPELKRILDQSWKDISRYPDPQSVRLRKTLAQWHGVAPENIVAANGASELIYWIARLGNSSKTAVFAPAFTEYAAATAAAGGRADNIPANEENGFRHDFTNQGAGADLVYIGNPNNPTGNVYEGSLLQSWIERHLKARPQAVIAVDESFLPFLELESSISLARFAAQKPGVIVLRSLTKILSIPGLRLGYSIAHPELSKKLSSLMPSWRVNSIAQKCGEALFSCTQFLNDSVRALKTGREQLARELRGMAGLKVFDSSVNFLLVKLNPGTPGASTVTEVLAQRGVLVRPCDDFAGLEKDRFVRLAVRKPDENTRLVKYLKEILFRG